jgi:hypothetical protein
VGLNNRPVHATNRTVRPANRKAHAVTHTLSGPNQTLAPSNHPVVAATTRFTPATGSLTTLAGRSASPAQQIAAWAPDRLRPDMAGSWRFLPQASQIPVRTPENPCPDMACG